MRRRAHHIGRVRIAVAEILTANGYPVSPGKFRIPQGYWRSPHQDVYRFEFYALNPDTQEYCNVGCWLTMTKFLQEAKKHGLHIQWERLTGELWSGKPSD